MAHQALRHTIQRRAKKHMETQETVSHQDSQLPQVIFRSQLKVVSGGLQHHMRQLHSTHLYSKTVQLRCNQQQEVLGTAPLASMQVPQGLSRDGHAVVNRQTEEQTETHLGGHAAHRDGRLRHLALPRGCLPELQQRPACVGAAPHMHHVLLADVPHKPPRLMVRLQAHPLSTRAGANTGDTDLSYVQSALALDETTPAMGQPQQKALSQRHVRIAMPCLWVLQLTDHNRLGAEVSMLVPHWAGAAPAAPPRAPATH